MRMTRRHVLGAGMAATVVAGAALPAVAVPTAPLSSADRKLLARLDEFAGHYLRDRSAPGMTLVLTDREGWKHTRTYGSGAGRALQADELVHIGSITKSFIALVVLQLRDEGKLDLHRPLVEYLPWLRIQSDFPPVTTHHLLTHTSGLPSFAEVFPSDPSAGHLAAYAPGLHYNYNNFAYALLGLLAWTLDGRELPQLFRERIFEPLDMSMSEPVIGFDMRSRTVESYAPFMGDRPYPRAGRLCEAAPIVHTSAAGCIASTAHDMGAYLRMIANHGRVSRGALVSAESFVLFATRHIAAPGFGPNASYGYGIAVDEVDGHTTLTHTGGMVSFMSAMEVDIDAGIGAFAAINAQQDYRPTEVVRYAVALMRAQRERKTFPALPPAYTPKIVPRADDHAGVFRGDAGEMEFVSENDRLFVLRDARRVPLEQMDDDRFLAAHADLDRFPLIFARNAAGAVAEVSCGGDWYTNDAYAGPRRFDYPSRWDSYVGHYRNEDCWIGSIRIVLLKGRLMLDGGTPLQAQGDLFRLRGRPHSTEWIRFGEIVNGRCMRLKFSGRDLWRVAAP